MATYSATITASSDDAAQAAGTVDLTGVQLNANAATHYIGGRFLNVTIPPGSTINTATLDVYITSGSFDDPDVTIYAHDTDDAATFTTTTNDISNRTATTATTIWTATALGVGADTSPDFAAVIQEVIDRAGWSSGNDIAIILKGNSGSSNFRVRAYDDGGGSYMTLNINYTAPAAGGQPPRTMHQFRQRGIQG